MPDHVHLLITPQGITIERAVGLIKGGFSHRVGSKFPVWQKSFTERRMRDAEEFVVRREYVHQNPVRAGMVQYPEDYAFSSAFGRRTAAAEAAE
jgi:putative transposase